MFSPEKMTYQPFEKEKLQEVKIESTRIYEPSSVIVELGKTGVIFANQITPDTKVLLIGDGQGMDTQQFVEMGVESENIISVNYEQGEVDQANASVLKNTGVKMKQGDATKFEDLERAELEENSQDVVTLMHVLEVPNIKGNAEKSLVGNIVRILKPGGELLVSQYKHKFTKNERDLQKQIGIEEITAENLQKQLGDHWRKKFKEEYGLEWEDGMRYGEISNIRSKDELMKLFEKDFDIKFEETESEYVLRMKNK